MPEITMNDGNKLNNAVKNNHPKRSFFPIKKPLAFTPRFGEISAFFAMRAETDDTLRLRSEFDLRTFTLQSPLLKNLTMHKNFFQVPMECILPFNWKSKIYPNPTIGDDVPNDAYTYGIWDFKKFFKPIPAWTSISSESDKRYYFLCLIYGCRLAENLFSSNSLANSLGYDIPVFNFTWPNLVSIKNMVFDAIDIDENVILSFKDLNLHSLLSLVDSYMLRINSATLASVPVATDYNVLSGLYESILTFVNSLPPKDFNLDKLYAYQLVCAHFYSNDKVDFVYSAELWRENFRSLIADPGEVLPTFSYNGTKVPYDYLSYGSLFSLSSFLNSENITLENFIRVCYSLFQIFAYQRSLKYSDYFTSARPQPLAVGNTSVDIQTDSTVSVVDITRKIQTQRFLNQVNRVGRKFSNYIAGLFGQVPAPDWHDPKVLAHTQEVVYGSETENTGDIQFSRPNSITTQLRCNSNRYEFEVDIDRPSIILGLLSFDIERFYTLASERDNFYKDRYDMFNPYMQFIGDQAILKREYNRDIQTEGNFGYCTRYLEYKMSFPRAVGGFMTDALPSWLFTAKDNLNYANSAFINPEFIRSNPSELDDFYLNGVSFATDKYFHFICLVNNYVSTNRPMVVNPQILG